MASPYRGAARCGAACSGPRAAAPRCCRTDAVGRHGGAGSSEINESESGRGGAGGEASVGGQKRPQFASLVKSENLPTLSVALDV